MKHKVIAMRLEEKPQIFIMEKTDGMLLGLPVRNILGSQLVELPEGCIGIMYCFESKKAARKCYGKDISLVRIKVKETKEKSK